MRYAVLLIVACLGCVPPASPPASQTWPTASPELQEKRKAYVIDLHVKKVILKIDGRRIYVLPKFNAGNIDDKEKIIAVVHAWMYELPQSGNHPARTEHVYINDGQTGKTLGSYSPARGLELD